MESNARQEGWSDRGLFDLCELPYYLRKHVKDWMTSKADEQRKQAGTVIASLVQGVLGSSLTEYGREKLASLGQDFELAETMGGAVGAYEGKFYRDHLHHSIRVGLMARAIARALRRSGIADQRYECSDCMCAGLLHDIGIAPSNLCKGLKAIGKYIEACPALWYVPGTTLVNWENYHKGVTALGLDESIGKGKLAELGENLNHALVGAIQGVSMFDLDTIGSDTTSRIARILKAIALHDSQVERRLVFTEEPLAVIVVIADELQEWARPSWLDGSVPLPSLERLCLHGAIQATLDYKCCSVRGFSPLKQIEGKQAALGRLVLDSDFPEVTLSYILPPYETLDLRSLANAYHKLWHLRGKDAYESRQFAELPEPDSRFGFLAGLGSVDEVIGYLVDSTHSTEWHIDFSCAAPDALLTSLSYTRMQFTKQEDGRVKLVLVDDNHGTANTVRLIPHTDCGPATQGGRLSPREICYLVPLLVRRILRFAVWEKREAQNETRIDIEKESEAERIQLVASRIQSKVGGTLIDPVSDRKLALLVARFGCEFSSESYYLAIRD